MTHFSPITAIALDLGNVLIKVDHGRFCRRLGDAAGFSAQEVYTAVFASGLEPDYDTGRLTSQEFYRSVCQLFQVHPPFPQFCRWWQDIFDPMEDMESLVAALARRYPLFLLSNTNALHFPYIYRRFPLVRHMIPSCSLTAINNPIKGCGGGDQFSVGFQGD